MRRQPFSDAIYGDRDYQFYLFQLIFWVGLSVVTFFSLTLWYGTAEWTHVAHTLLQALLGAIISWPLRAVFTYLWDKKVLVRVCLSLLSVAVVSALWTGARMLTFIWIVLEEKNLWQDFGGWYFGAFFIFLCWAAFYYGVKYYHLLQLEHQKTIEAAARTQEEHFQRLKAEAVAKEAQLKMLRYQLNPHFLFNTLNAIYALIKLKESKTAQKMVQQLSGFLRYSLDNDPVHQVTLESEVEALKLYLNIEQTRFDERLTLKFDVSEEAKLAGVPSLLLQPLAENAIKHAISPSETGGTIAFKATVEDSVLCLEVSDSGPGLPDSGGGFTEGRGVGLRNTRDRLKTLYENDYSFEFGQAEPKGLKISIRIPFAPVAIDDTDSREGGETASQNKSEMCP